jgi:hypothetical protein
MKSFHHGIHSVRCACPPPPPPLGTWSNPSNPFEKAKGESAPPLSGESTPPFSDFDSEMSDSDASDCANDEGVFRFSSCPLRLHLRCYISKWDCLKAL